jgi:hypothetical protein
MNLDDVVPGADHVTKQARVIEAPRAVVWEELHRLKLSALPVTLVLSAVRALPAVLAGRTRGGLDRPFVDLIPIPKLSSEAPTAVVYGGVLQPWRLSGGDRPPALDDAGVRDFQEPGWVRIGMEFRLAPAVGGAHLSSETRVAATDPATRKQFDRYWRVVGPGSSAIRWEVLTAVARNAEARTRG